MCDHSRLIVFSTAAAGHLLRLLAPEHELRQLDHVDAEVEHRAAAQLLLVQTVSLDGEPCRHFMISVNTSSVTFL